MLVSWFLVAIPDTLRNSGGRALSCYPHDQSYAREFRAHPSNRTTTTTTIKNSKKRRQRLAMPIFSTGRPTSTMTQPQTRKINRSRKSFFQTAN